LALGTGNGRNDTGIVAVVENRNLSPSRTWLLTGDCNYTHIEPSLAPKNPIAVVVPHHGANLNGGTAAPKPFRGVNEYCRLLYSFGPDNAHGATGVRHPTLNTATLNIGAGWDHGAWHLPAPADKDLTPSMTSERPHDILLLEPPAQILVVSWWAGTAFPHYSSPHAVVV
jgi:hypothetical protein